MADRASASRDLHTINRFFSQQSGYGLSERGKQEAARVSAYFARHPVDALYCSPLTRARETAHETASALGLPCQVREELRELQTGRLRDHSPEARMVERLAHASALPPRTQRALLGVSAIFVYYHAWRLNRTVGGESDHALRARVERFFDELRIQHGARARVVLFAHGYLIHHVARRLTDARPRVRLDVWLRPYIPHGGITEMELSDEGRLELTRYNWGEHLR